MEFIEAGDLKISYTIKGSGYPLVMIMGFTGNMDWWDPEFLEALAAKYRLLIFDNRGAGRTVTPSEGQFSIEMFAEDTALLMDKLGIEHAHVFGFSMGGLIAQVLALRHPEKVSKLILGGTFCGGKETVMPSKEVTQKLTDSGGGLDAVCSRTLELMFPEKFLADNPGFVKSFSDRYKTAPIRANNAIRQLAATVKNSTYRQLPDIKIPVLVVRGSEDIIIPPRNAEVLAEKIEGAKLITYNGAGHCFMSTNREEFLKDLLEFLG